MRLEETASVGEIATALGVSSSTASRWVRDVPLTPEQRAALDARNPALNPAVRGSEARGRSARDARRRHQERGRLDARRGDPLHLTGCMLYWAEGSKSRNRVVFVNSDAAMMVVFLRFLRECFGVQDERLALCVNCHLVYGFTLGEIERHWLETLGLPATTLRKAAVNRASAASSRVRGNVLPYGTARLALGSVEVVQRIYGSIQEYAGFDQPAWLG